MLVAIEYPLLATRPESYLMSLLVMKMDDLLICCLTGLVVWWRLADLSLTLVLGVTENLLADRGPDSCRTKLD